MEKLRVQPSHGLSELQPPSKNISISVCINSALDSSRALSNTEAIWIFFSQLKLKVAVCRSLWIIPPISQFLSCKAPRGVDSISHNTKAFFRGLHTNCFNEVSDGMSGHYSYVYTCKLKSCKESSAVEINCLHCKFALWNYFIAARAMSEGFGPLQKTLEKLESWNGPGIVRTGSSYAASVLEGQRV